MIWTQQEDAEWAEETFTSRFFGKWVPPERRFTSKLLILLTKNQNQHQRDLT
jgi:hypothetical protein